jgi:hypothetical protein
VFAVIAYSLPCDVPDRNLILLPTQALLSRFLVLSCNTVVEPAAVIAVTFTVNPVPVPTTFVVATQVTTVYQEVQPSISLITDGIHPAATITCPLAVHPVIANISHTAYQVPATVGVADMVDIQPAQAHIPKASIITYLVVESGVNVCVA